jgi:hypothetical protein
MYDWIILHDQGTGILDVDTNNVGIGVRTYEFVLKTKFENYYREKYINITFYHWSIGYCDRCETEYVCKVWQSGYRWNSGDSIWEFIPEKKEKIYVSPQIQSAQTFGQAAIGGGVAAGTVSSIFSSSSSQGAWSSINQFQLYLLLPLVGAHIHADVLAFLEGFNFSMISFSFIDLASMPGISSVLALLPESSNSAYMQSIGLEYESTLRNIAGMLLLLVGLVILHAGVVTPLQMQAKKYNEGHRFKRWMGLVFLFFTFTVYIRVVLESYLLVCLSCVLEFWKLGPNEAIAVFAFLVVFTVSFFVLWNYEGRPQTEVGDSYFKELFSGLKPTRAARLYFSTFILRRFLSVFIIVPGELMSLFTRIVLFAGVHSGVFVFTFAVRPFQGVKDNIIEAINDLSFWGLSCILVHFNSKDAWDDTSANTVIYFMLGMSLLTTSIQLVFLIHCSVKYLKHKCSKVNSEQIDQTQISRSDLPSLVYPSNLVFLYHFQQFSSSEHSFNFCNTNFSLAICCETLHLSCYRDFHSSIGKS